MIIWCRRDKQFYFFLIPICTRTGYSFFIDPCGLVRFWWDPRYLVRLRVPEIWITCEFIITFLPYWNVRLKNEPSSMYMLTNIRLTFFLKWSCSNWSFAWGRWRYLIYFFEEIINSGIHGKLTTSSSSLKHVLLFGFQLL